MCEWSEPFECDNCFMCYVCSYENIEKMPINEEFLEKVKKREAQIRKVRQDLESRLRERRPSINNKP